MTAQTVRIAGHGGDEIEAYLARPEGDGARGGVVVIHHMPGYDRATKEIVRRFAELGYDAICPNLYWREAPGAAPDDAAATVRAQGGVPDERLVGDVGGSAEHLRSLDSSNGKVGVIGYCSGGRQSVLAACNLDLDAAVDCYGAFVTGTHTRGLPAQCHQPGRAAAQPARAAAGAVRQGGLVPEPGAGRRAGRDPDRQRQAARVPQL